MTAAIEEAARHYAARDLGRAARVCLEIIRDDPLQFDALHLLGVICSNQGQHADAVCYLLRADAVRPRDGRLQANLGVAYGAVRRYDRAAEAYRRALESNIRDAGLLNNLGLALWGMDDASAAIEIVPERA